MVNNRVTWCLKKQGLLSVHQCGYQKHQSTTYQLVYAVFMQFKTLNRKETFGYSILRFEGAFDDTWRYNIMKQLHD